MKSGTQSKGDSILSQGKGPGIASDAPRTAAMWAGKVPSASNGILLAWCVNGALVVAAFTWIYFFGESLQVIELIGHRLALIRLDAIASDPYRAETSVTIVAAGAIIAAVTFVVMFGSLFLGRGRFRTTRMWLILIA